MGFLNYNIIFDIDISNYETDYTKIRGHSNIMFTKKQDHKC